MIEQSHGIADGLNSVSSTGLGITIPDYTRASQQASHSPSASQHQQHGIFRGLALASGISAAASAGGGGYSSDPTNITNNTPSDPGLQSSFSDLHPSMSSMSGLGTHRGSTGGGDDEDELFPLSASHSPYLQPHSRPLSPNSEGHPSPAAYPPQSPYPSPGPSPIALSPSAGGEGGLSPAAYSPGAHSEGYNSGVEGGDPVSPTSRGRLRGRVSVKHFKQIPQHPYSATSGSLGQTQQAHFVRGVGVSPSRRSDAVESRHSRHRGHSVGEGYAAGGSRGTSPYPSLGLGEMRRQSASSNNVAALQAQSMNIRPQLPHGNSGPLDIPPVEVHSGSAAPSREVSLTRDAYPYNSTVQPIYINPSHAAHYLAPSSPHSPSFVGYLPGMGSPTSGMQQSQGQGSHHSPQYSPHPHSQHSLSPHSVQVPSLTPSPEIFGPNVAGHPGSTHSSPALGLDPAGTVGNSELFLLLENNGLGPSSGNMQDPGMQYPQRGYVEPQLVGALNSFGVDGFGNNSNAMAENMWAAQQQQQQQQQQQLQQQQLQQQNQMGLNTWPVDPTATTLPLTTAHVEAAYGTGLNAAAGDGAYSVNPAFSVQANIGDELAAVERDPAFWQGASEIGSQPIPGGGQQAAWGSNDPTQYPIFSSSPPGNTGPGLGQDPTLEMQSAQQQQYYSQFQNALLQQQHLVDPHTVPPSPAKNMVLPWNGQPDGQLPQGNVEDWHQLQFSMQAQARPQPDSIHQVLASQPGHGGLVPPRAMPMRRRSKSDSYNQGHHPSMMSSSPAEPSSFQVYDSPRTQQAPLNPHYVMDFGNRNEDVVLGGDHANLKITKSLPTAVPKGGHHHHRRVPTVAVSDWSHVSMDPRGPAFGMSQQHSHGHGQSTMNHKHGLPAMPAPLPPFNHSHTYPQSIPAAAGDVTLRAGPSNLGRSTSIPKQKQQGQRNEVDEDKLSRAFTPGSWRDDPALLFFLQLIRNSRFYRDDVHEPLLGTPEAEQILGVVRRQFPQDVRFAPRAEAGYERGMVDNETRESQSIFMLFTENNQCLICGARKDRTGRALGHVRSDIGHRPYHCHCEKCLQSPKCVFSFRD